METSADDGSNCELMPTTSLADQTEGPYTGASPFLAQEQTFTGECLASEKYHLRHETSTRQKDYSVRSKRDVEKSLAYRARPRQAHGAASRRISACIGQAGTTQSPLFSREHFASRFLIVAYKCARLIEAWSLATVAFRPVGAEPICRRSRSDRYIVPLATSLSVARAYRGAASLPIPAPLCRAEKEG